MQYCFISDVWVKNGEDQARMGTELKPPKVQPCGFGTQPSSILCFTMVRCYYCIPWCAGGVIR